MKYSFLSNELLLSRAKNNSLKMLQLLTPFRALGLTSKWNSKLDFSVHDYKWIFLSIRYYSLGQ